MYQPSVSDLWLLLHASGLASCTVDVLIWRAVKPNNSFRSPVSVMVLVTLTTPPRLGCVGCVFAGVFGTPPPSPSAPPPHIGFSPSLIMYVLVLLLIMMVRLRSH